MKVITENIFNWFRTICIIYYPLVQTFQHGLLESLQSIVPYQNSLPIWLELVQEWRVIKLKEMNTTDLLSFDPKTSRTKTLSAEQICSE